MLILSQEPRLGPELISRHILQADPSVSARPEPRATDLLVSEGTLKDRVEAIEARILRETLTRLKWNKSRAADELGLSRVGLRSKLDRYGVHQPGKTTAPEEGGLSHVSGNTGTDRRDHRCRPIDGDGGHLRRAPLRCRWPAWRRRTLAIWWANGR